MRTKRTLVTDDVIWSQWLLLRALKDEEDPGRGQLKQENVLEWPQRHEWKEMLEMLSGYFCGIERVKVALGSEQKWQTLAVEKFSYGEAWLWRGLAVERLGCGEAWLWRSLAVEKFGCEEAWLWRSLAMKDSGKHVTRHGFLTAREKLVWWEHHRGCHGD